MTKLTAVAASLLLCAALLAACGDSGSTSSIKTATVPSGKLGSAAPTETFCTPYRSKYPELTKVGILRAIGISCDEANTLAAKFFQNKLSVPGYKCTKKIYTDGRIDLCTKAGLGIRVLWA